MYLLGRTKNSDPHRNVLSDCGLGPMPHGQSVHLPGARGPRQKGTVPGDQGGVCGPSRRARPSRSTWCLPAAPVAAGPPAPTGVSHSQRAACGDRAPNWPDVSSCQEGASGPGQNTTGGTLRPDCVDGSGWGGAGSSLLGTPLTTQ